MSQEIIKKFGPVLSSIDINMIMQSSFLESMYNTAAESEKRTTSLLTKILNVLDGQKNAMMTNVSRDTISKEYSFVKSNLKNIFQTQNKESNNRVNQLFTNYSSELLNAMTLNDENLSQMVSKTIDTIDMSIKSPTLSNVTSISNAVSENILSQMGSLSDLTQSLSEQNNNSFNSQEISRLLTERVSIEDGDEITESYSYQQLIYEENKKQTSLLERLVGIGEQRLENYEDAERRRLLSDPSPREDDSQNQNEEENNKNKREKPSLSTIGKWVAGIGALVLASPFILGFIEGFFGKKIGELIDAMKQKALEFLSDPKVLLGIAALVGAIGLLLRPIATLITGFKLLGGMLKLGGKAITGLGKMLGKLKLGKMFKNALNGFGNFFKGSLGKISDMFKGSVGKISSLGASVADSVKTAGKSVANRLKSVKATGGKGLFGGLFGALASTSVATSTTTTPKATSAGDVQTDVDKPKVPDVQTDVDKPKVPDISDSPDKPKKPPILGQVITDGLPTVSDARRVPPIDEAKAAKSFMKSSAKYGVKLVPVVGAIAGALFAAGRLIEGDHVGAAMEAGGVLAPSFTGGATIDIAILARDMYKSYYGTNPENDDPELVKQRTLLLKEYIERKMSSVGAAKINQEDQYMSSDAAMITPGKAAGVGGVTVNTAPAGGYKSSTAMALSQTEINRIREIQGLPPTPKIVPPTSKDTNLGKKVDQMSNESSAMQSRGAPVIVRGGDNMMKGGDVIKGGDTTIINNTVIESENFRNHIPT